MTDGCPGIITIAIVRLNDTWFASVTVTPKLNRPNPVVVGIPLISPLDGSSASPAGSEPFRSSGTGAVPPAMPMCARYGTFSIAFGRTLDVMCRSKMLRLRPRKTVPLASVSATWML